MVAMVALGELSRIDYAIHADTTWGVVMTYNELVLINAFNHYRGRCPVAFVALLDDFLHIVNRWSSVDLVSFDKGVWVVVSDIDYLLRPAITWSSAPYLLPVVPVTPVDVLDLYYRITPLI